MKHFCLILSCSLMSLCGTVLAQDSVIPASDPMDSGAAPDLLMEKAAVIKHAPTKTTLTASAGTLGQPIVFNATVRTFAAAGSPEGTVYLVDRGTVIAQFAVTPTNSPDTKYAYSVGSYTVTNAAGSQAYFFGKHVIKGQFYSTSIYNRSTGTAKFTIPLPVYTGVTNGVNIATVEAGSGPGATNGQTVSVVYSGYLAKKGKLFDDSDLHGGSPISWILGGPRVISGFNEGVLGIQMGETRIIEIPPAEAYGKKGIPPTIPPNSTLVFLVKLVPAAP